MEDFKVNKNQGKLYFSYPLMITLFTKIEKK